MAHGRCRGHRRRHRARRCEAAEPMARMASYERQACAEPLRRPLHGALRGTGLCTLHRGRQADQGLPRRGRPADRHLPHRRGRVGAHAWARCSRWISRRAPRATGHLEAGADRPLLLHFAVQLPAQPGGAQDRAGAGRGLPICDEARLSHAAGRHHHRRGIGRDRPAQGRLLHPARHRATAATFSPPTTG